MPAAPCSAALTRAQAEHVEHGAPGQAEAAGANDEAVAAALVRGLANGDEAGAGAGRVAMCSENQWLRCSSCRLNGTHARMHELPPATPLGHMDQRAAGVGAAAAAGPGTPHSHT